MCEPCAMVLTERAALTLEELLLELSLGDLDLDSLVDLLLVTSLVVGIVLDGCREESVDECRLSKARLASNLYRLVSKSITGRMAARRSELFLSSVKHTIIVKPAPRLATILCRWLGRLAMPMGEALSAAGGAMVDVRRAELVVERRRERRTLQSQLPVERGNREFGIESQRSDARRR